MSGLYSAAFAGVFKAMKPPAGEQVTELEIADDVEGEQEALPNLPLSESNGEDYDPEDENVEASGNYGTPQMAELRNSLLNASKGVTEGTDEQYRRYYIFVITFLECIHTH